MTHFDGKFKLLTESSLEHCRPTILADCLEGQSAHLRQISASLYKESEQLQLEKASNYVRSCVREWAAKTARDTYFAWNLTVTAEKHFNVGALHKTSLAPYERKKEDIERRRSSGEMSDQEYTEKYAEALNELLIERFKKQFLGVHRKLGRSIGLVLPIRGRGQRYVLGDTLLKALVLANVPPGERLQYDAFLDRVYRRYGLVIGQQQAHDSGLYDRKPINAEYYNDNRSALELKLKNAWLLEQYSDATALIVNVNREADDFHA